MKYRSLTLFTLLGLLLCFSCKKDSEVNIEQFEITKENITAGINSATLSGTYSYSGTIDGITVCLSEGGVHSREFETALNGKNFAVEMTGLRPGTTYQYYYSVDYGFSKPFITETNSFTTQSESPTVKTLEVLAIDSTTFRVKCEVEADGGSEVSERGICWNTYGDPILDDETLPYANGGLGQYSLRLENLTVSTKYYVRAYAKNTTGIGLGEVLEFRTGGNTTLPQVSTVEISNVTYNAAQCLGNVAHDGGLDLIERGVCWGLEPDPTINVHHAVAEGMGLGNFTAMLSDLMANTTYHVRCYAKNSKGIAYGEELTFSTTEGLPTVTTGAITDISGTSAKGGGEVTDQGASNVTERGLCWSTSHNPTTSDNHATNGTGAGSYTVQMNGLTPNATYYVRAYAKNAQGISYGAEVDFTATEGLPVVKTLDVTDVTATTAIGHGKVTDQGGSSVTERGICWATTSSPTINGSHAHSGTGSGAYEISLTGLAPGTTYYVRAYAKNVQGLTYGEQKEFTTTAALPTVETGTINGTTVGGNVTHDGGAPVTERGICWSTNHNPTLDDSHGSSGSGTGTYTVELTDLEPGTTYYVKAYATNSAGTAYGNEKTLTTEANLPTVTTGEVSNVQQTTALGSGNVTDDGGANVTERGVCWSTGHNPTLANSHANDGIGGMGSFTVPMTGLTANMKYYVRAYAKNSSGIRYGSEVDFTTAQNISAPTVTTSPVTDITETTATGGGKVTSTGGVDLTERGICWSTNHNPTINGSHASNGTDLGIYTVNMTGLTQGTTYYVRAYAMNSAGLIGYGDEVSFPTLAGATLPTVVTVTQGSMMGGDVIDDGGAEVTDRGLCLSTQPNPAVTGEYINGGSGLGPYFVELPTLVPNTTYYICAYATNSVGTAYGGESSFSIPGQNYTITVSANPSNGGTVSGGGTYQQGQSCTVTATANNGYTFANWTENGNVVSTNASYSFTVNGNRSLVANFNAQSQAPEGAINGKFTINENGNQIYFSKGNLQYDKVTGEWSFMEHQYDIVETDDQDVGYNYANQNIVSLFGWGTSGWDNGNVYFQPYDTQRNGNYYQGFGYGPTDGTSYTYDLTGTYANADWGVHNPISNGGSQAGQWRTLTKDEWTYVFQGRSGASLKYGHGKVNGVNGMILLPDEWTLPSGLSFTAGNSNWTNVYTTEQWMLMEQNGAVFLPAAGYRSETSVHDMLYNYGYYWSVSCSDSDDAYYVYFSNMSLNPQHDSSRDDGRSVRLVLSAQ